MNELMGTTPIFPDLHVTGYGAAKNLHLLVEDRLRPINAGLRIAGGLNRHNEPNYRVVWGWERPLLYGVGGGEFLEYFHLERWMAFEHLATEDEWYAREKENVRLIGTRYRIEPYPRRGDYMEIRTCQWATKDATGKKVASFRWPDSKASGESDLLWYEAALIHDKLRLARTRLDIEKEVAEDQNFARQLEAEKNQRIADSYSIRELAEEETACLIRNPSLRMDPNLMLSPTVGVKQTRHRIPMAI